MGQKRESPDASAAERGAERNGNANTPSLQHGPGNVKGPSTANVDRGNGRRQGERLQSSAKPRVPDDAVTFGEPVCNLEAEQSTLGSMMIDATALRTGLQIVSREDFYRLGHRPIFDALRALAEREVPVDLVTVQEELRACGKLDLQGEPTVSGVSADYLMALIDSVPTAKNIEYYASIVREKAGLRRIAEQATRLASAAADPTVRPERIAELTAELAKPTTETRLVTVSHAELAQGELPNPEWVVDKLIPKGGVCILGGDSNVGKSFIAFHMAQAVAGGYLFLGKFPVEQTKVLVFDAESGPNLLERRVKKLLAGMRIDNADMPDDVPLLFTSQPFTFKPEIIGPFTEYLIREGIGLVICDPLIHFTGGLDENSNNEMASFFEVPRAIGRRAMCSFLFIHHARKENRLASNAGGQMLRGATAIRTVLDSHLFVRKLEGGRVLIEHDKSREAERLPNFVIEIKDEGEAATVVRYAGEAQDCLEKVELAKLCILRTLADAGGPLPRAEIIQQVKGEKVGERDTIGERTAAEALKRLYADGAGEIKKDRVGNSTVYKLKVLDAELFEGGE